MSHCNKQPLQHFTKHMLLWALFFTSPLSFGESTCFGTTSDGYLQDGVKLPAKGENFVSYSTIARLAGRTYVHSNVRDILLQAYEILEITQPSKVFKYAETGFKEGGTFKPHRTHKNGLSVDFMTSVVNTDGDSVHLSTHPLNRFGYDIEFDKSGRYKNLSIDYEALAAHITALDQAAKANGHRLWRVIFDPQLQPNLFTTSYGEYLRNNITFSKKRAWVRHDEHYHLDFVIPCL